MARGLAVGDLDFEARAAVVESYAQAEAEADLSPEAAEVLAAGRHVLETIATVEGAMAPMPAKMVLWRGASPAMFPSGNPADTVRQTYTETGFTSATTDRSAVEVPEGGWLMAVVVQAGVPVIWIGEDHELLIDRDVDYRVVSFANNVVKVVALTPAATPAPVA